MWTQNHPLTRTEIIALSTTRSWKSSTIHILLNNLLEKGAIIVDGFIRTGKNYGRCYTAAISRKEYERRYMRECFQKVDLTIGEVFDAIIENGSIAADELDELEMLLKERKNKNM